MTELYYHECIVVQSQGAFHDEQVAAESVIGLSHSRDNIYYIIIYIISGHSDNTKSGRAAMMPRLDQFEPYLAHLEETESDEEEDFM